MEIGVVKTKKEKMSKKDNYTHTLNNPFTFTEKQRFGSTKPSPPSQQSSTCVPSVHLAVPG
jgi:hypothetical protein